MADLVFILVLLGVVACLFYAMVYGPESQKKKLERKFPLGARVRITADGLPPLLPHLIGTTAEVVGYTHYSYIPSRVKLRVPVVPNYPTTMDIGFTEDLIEPIPELTLVTGVELKRNYNID
jgi:hypothetical protein